MKRTTIAIALLLTHGLACSLSGLPGGGGETATPEASPTATRTPEATAEAPPTPTATIAPGGGAGEATPEITSIPLCPDLELEIEFQQVQSMQIGEASLQNTLTASGRVPLSVDLGTEPPQVSGEGELPISGSGQAGGCAWQNSGTMAYQLKGEIVPGPGGHPELHLGGQRSMNITTSGTCGGPGGGVPFEDIGVHVLQYQDGQAIEWSWSVPMGGVEGNAKWTLHILCEE